MRDSSSTFLTVALAISPSSKAKLIYEGIVHCIAERLYFPDSDQHFHYLLTLCNDEDDPGEPMIFTNYQDLLTAIGLVMKKWGDDIHLGPYWAAIGPHA